MRKGREREGGGAVTLAAPAARDFDRWVMAAAVAGDLGDAGPWRPR
jgi:hypothetical protein